jgi:hypothetical protein
MIKMEVCDSAQSHKTVAVIQLPAVPREGELIYVSGIPMRPVKAVWWYDGGLLGNEEVFVRIVI